MNLCTRCDCCESQFHTSVAFASFGSNSAIKIVLNHDDLLASIWVRPQHSLDRGVGGLAFASSDVPPNEEIKVRQSCQIYWSLYLRITNHELEVIVAVNACRDVLVVVLKLFNSDDMIALVRLPERHEVAEDLIGGLAAGLEVGVVRHIIGGADIVDGDLTASVFIKDSISLMDHVLASIIKLATNGAQKFVKRQLSILIGIEVLNDLSHLDFTKC